MDFNQDCVLWGISWTAVMKRSIQMHIVYSSFVLSFDWHYCRALSIFAFCEWCIFPPVLPLNSARLFPFTIHRAITLSRSFQVSPCLDILASGESKVRLSQRHCCAIDRVMALWKDRQCHMTPGDNIVERLIRRNTPVLRAQAKIVIIPRNFRTKVNAKITILAATRQYHDVIT